MTTDHSVPPLRELPTGRLTQRAEHLRAEIARSQPPRVPTLRRLRPQSRFGRLAPVVVAVVLATVVATPAFGVGRHLLDLITGGTPVSTARLSDQDLRFLSAVAKGVSPSDVPASKRAQLDAVGSTGIRQIAVRDGRAFFVIDKSDGSHCYAVGDEGDSNLFGGIECPATSFFPTPAHPILDMSVVRLSPADPRPTLTRLEGFAADGVARVAVITASGQVTADTPVIDNVYSAQGNQLPDQPINGLVAFGADGTQLYSQCLARNAQFGC